MDWGLVLMSQGIESIIDHDAQEGWVLLVRNLDQDAALASIRQYVAENRRANWPQDVIAKLGFDWASLAWVLLIMAFFTLEKSKDLHTPGIMDTSFVAHGQWWRFFTATWLHADVAHLATNATVGVLVLGLIMNRYGTGVGLLLCYLAGAIGNAFIYLVSSHLHRSLGASGVVMGGLGMLAVHSLLHRPALSRKHLISAISASVMLFVLLGVSPDSDVLAHAGGFLGGLALGTLASTLPLAIRNAAGPVSWLLFALLVIVPWFFALRRPTL